MTPAYNLFPTMNETPGSRYEIKPQVYDVFPNDGILDGGSLANPWVIEPIK